MHGRPKKNWLDNVHEDCAAKNMTLHQDTKLTQDYSKWRNIVCQVGCWSAETV